MKEYFSRLIKELTDNHNLFAELMLAWIGIMLTSLVILALLYFLGG